MIPVSKPSLSAEELSGIKEVFDSNWLGQGAFVKEFEDSIKKYLNSGNVVAVNSGTSAISLALESLNIGEGDEIIVPSFTFCATIQAIVNVGAKPVFCEISESTLNIDSEFIEPLISSKTRAIVPVHYMGIPCDLDRIYSIAESSDLRVVEDAAHAFGSKYNNKFIGAKGDITCFSFDPIKNITCGEGGAVVTFDNEIEERVRRKRVLGIDRSQHAKVNHDWYYEVISKGSRSHMSNINASIGLTQLKKAEYFREKKNKIVSVYNEAFRGLTSLYIIPYNIPDVFPFGYTVRVLNGRRDEFMEYLRRNSVQALVNYIPNHLQPYFRDGSILPVTESVFKEIISLPLYVDMTDEDIDKIIDLTINFFNNICK